MLRECVKCLKPLEVIKNDAHILDSKGMWVTDADLCRCPTCNGFFILGFDDGCLNPFQTIRRKWKKKKDVEG